MLIKIKLSLKIESFSVFFIPLDIFFRYLSIIIKLCSASFVNFVLHHLSNFSVVVSVLNCYTCFLVLYLVPWPGDSKGTFSIWESSCYLQYYNQSNQ